MFAFLPEQIERHIWKFYYTNSVVKSIKDTESVWESPSDELLDLCRESGTIQHKHTDLERILFKKNKPYKDIVFEACFKKICGNCSYHGFPCTNACFHGGFNEKILKFWNLY